jgi:aspartate/glutamate racemase
MLRLTARDLGRMGVKCAGLLATDGTVRTGAYQEAFLLLKGKNGSAKGRGSL